MVAGASPRKRLRRRVNGAACARRAAAAHQGRAQAAQRLGARARERAQLAQAAPRRPAPPRAPRSSSGSASALNRSRARSAGCVARSSSGSRRTASLSSALRLPVTSVTRAAPLMKSRTRPRRRASDAATRSVERTILSRSARWRLSSAMPRRACWSAGLVRRRIALRSSPRADQPDPQLVDEHARAVAHGHARRARTGPSGPPAAVVRSTGTVGGRPPPARSGRAPAVPGSHCTKYSAIRPSGWMLQRASALNGANRAVDLELDPRLVAGRDLHVLDRSHRRAGHLHQLARGSRRAALSKITSTR